uniref:Uncharacterized protein n=1 Tax=Sphaerodactylus townsendi TaxID=933632 RepID=A0ACB8EHY6_9SAUR
MACYFCLLTRLHCSSSSLIFLVQIKYLNSQQNLKHQPSNHPPDYSAFTNSSYQKWTDLENLKRKGNSGGKAKCYSCWRAAFQDCNTSEQYWHISTQILLTLFPNTILLGTNMQTILTTQLNESKAATSSPKQKRGCLETGTRHW